MSDPNKGLYRKYEVTKISNPSKKLNCIVLEFDDPLARVGIAAFAQACSEAGFIPLAIDLRNKLIAEETK